jgi:hypothetical protein
MFFTSRQYRCVRHIITIWLWPTMFNHCQPWSTIVNHGYGQSSHCQYGYGQPLSTIVNHGQWSWSISLCSSHCDNMDIANHVQPLSTMVNHSQPWSWSIKFNHIYVRHIATIWLCSSYRMFSV